MFLLVALLRMLTPKTLDLHILSAGDTHADLTNGYYLRTCSALVLELETKELLFHSLQN